MTAGDGASCLVVFARAPVAGQVKTRLCRSRPGEPAALTAEQAAAVHLAFVTDVCHSGARSGIARRRLYVAGEHLHPDLVRIAAETGFTLCEQQGSDLGARMAAAMAGELSAGARSVVLIGTDSPTLPTAYLQRAARFLAGAADIVLGPASDGGYYLIGARLAVPELFAPLPWGTSQVLPQTLQRLSQCRQSGLRVALLPFFYDVDTPSDLRLLACHLELSARAGDPLAAVSSAEDSWADLSGPDTLTSVHAPASRAVLQELGWLGRAS